MNDCYTVNSLKALAKLICDDIPTRKADIIAAITDAMGGEKIRGVFDRLDRIGQHIVAEAVFVSDVKVDFRKIEAKYQPSSSAHLIACKDPVLVQLISSDRKASKLCLAAAGDYIVVLPGKERDFIKTLADMGYIVPQFGNQI